MASRIVGLAADIKMHLLVIQLANPPQQIFIKSKDAWDVYGLPGAKKPMYAVNGDHGVFKLFVRADNGRVTEFAWSAKIVRDADDSEDLLFYDLERTTSQ